MLVSSASLVREPLSDFFLSLRMPGKRERPDKPDPQPWGNKSRRGGRPRQSRSPAPAVSGSPQALPGPRRRVIILAATIPGHSGSWVPQTALARRPARRVGPRAGQQRAWFGGSSLPARALQPARIPRARSQSARVRRQARGRNQQLPLRRGGAPRCQKALKVYFAAAPAYRASHQEPGARWEPPPPHLPAVPPRSRAQPTHPTAPERLPPAAWPPRAAPPHWLGRQAPPPGAPPLPPLPPVPRLPHPRLLSQRRESCF